jgi:hypothetical protein
MAQPTQVAQPKQAAPADASRYLPLLLVLFAGSGCSALIYETVWYQLLQLAIGSTAVSLGFLLATFMGGLCIGSVWFPVCLSSIRYGIMLSEPARGCPTGIPAAAAGRATSRVRSTAPAFADSLPPSRCRRRF